MTTSLMVMSHTWKKTIYLCDWILLLFAEVAGEARARVSAKVPPNIYFQCVGTYLRILETDKLFRSIRSPL
jgi:hypothetical protein